MMEHWIGDHRLDSLLRDASGYRYQKERADHLEQLLWAAAETAGGSLRVSLLAFHNYRPQDASIVTHANQQDNEYVVVAGQK